LVNVCYPDEERLLTMFPLPEIKFRLEMREWVETPQTLTDGIGRHNNGENQLGDEGLNKTTYLYIFDSDQSRSDATSQRQDMSDSHFSTI
jgi:hypothetical protein